MASIKDCHTMSSFFIKKYKERYNVDPNLNRNTARWSWDGILAGMSMAAAKELVEYYFSLNTANGHDFNWFAYNYDKIIRVRQEQADDRENINKLMEESRRRSEAWRASGKSAITSE